MKAALVSMLAVAVATAGCASAPEAGDAGPTPSDARAVALQDGVDQALARKPALDRRFDVTVDEVRAEPELLVFNLSVRQSAAFGREGRTLTVATTCRPNELDECVRKAMDAIDAVAGPR